MAAPFIVSNRDTKLGLYTISIGPYRLKKYSLVFKYPPVPLFLHNKKQKKRETLTPVPPSSPPPPFPILFRIGILISTLSINALLRHRGNRSSTQYPSTIPTFDLVDSAMTSM